MAFEGPSGSMGKPENADDYTRFIVGNITFYVENRILEKCEEDKKITFYVEEYGRFELEISDGTNS